jgi:hypothetical protein
LKNTSVIWPSGQCALEKPPDEFGLTVGSGFLENALRVGARRRPGDLERGGGGRKTIASDDFTDNAGLGSGEPEFCPKALDLGAQIGGRINNEDGDGGPVNIEDRHRVVGRERKDMGDKRRAVAAAA